MSLDPQRFPRLCAHLQALPAGLASHPACKAKGTLVRSFTCDLRPDQVGQAGLPPEVEALLLRPPSNSAWVSEALSWAGIYAVADLEGLDGPGWERWVARKNRELYTNPVMRLVMNLTAPRLALALSSAYWGVLHQGSRLQVLESGAGSAQVALDYPDRLFSETGARALGIAFGAALELSRARNLKLTLEGWTPVRALYSARWDP